MLQENWICLYYQFQDFYKMDFKLRAEIYLKQNGGDIDIAINRISETIDSLNRKDKLNENIKYSLDWVKKTKEELLKLKNQ